MLGIDERRQPSISLRFGNDVKAERGLTAALGTKDLNDPPPRHSTNAECQVQ